MKILVLFSFLVQSPVSMILDSAGNFRVMGWSDAIRVPATQWPEIFSVQVDLPDVPALLGTYRMEESTLVFVPQYPVRRGVRYRATVRIPGKEPHVEYFALPKTDATPTTIVERVYPTTNFLPENQLKFYIHFSAPMSRGEAYRRIHLIDEHGEMVRQPFLELTEELWDPEARRFTLFFDPGRIKRGLVPHNQMGSPLQEGKAYTLVIDHDWLDAEGKPLKLDYKKSFSVRAAERKVLDQATWRVVSPNSGTMDPVAVEFPKPIDRALMEHQLAVVNASGKVLEGSIEVDRDETRWRFIPKSPWQAGSYSIQVGAVIADLAGNTADHPFDVDVLDKIGRETAHETRNIAFIIN